MTKIRLSLVLALGVLPGLLLALPVNPLAVKAQRLRTNQTDLHCHPGYATQSSARSVIASSLSQSIDRSWLSGVTQQNQIDAFWSKVEEAGLENVGAFLDDSTRQFVIVLDSDSRQREEVQVIAGNILMDISFRTENRCLTKGDQSRLMKSLVPQFERFAQVHSGLSASIRESDGTLVIHVSAGDSGALLSEIPQLKANPVEVVTEESSPTSYSRCGDTAPHYGGSAFQGSADGSCQYRCTSAYKVKRLSDNVLGMATAGHCRIDTNWSGNLYSGTSFFGAFSGAHYGGFDDWAFITSSTYSPNIYTDPCCPSVRTSAGASTAYVGDVLCISGSVTGARCSMRIESTTAYICPGPCIGNEIQAKRTDGTIACQPGDSGAPMFSNVSNKVYGVLTGGDGTFGSATCFFNPVSRMTSAGYQVVTS